MGLAALKLHEKQAQEQKEESFLARERAGLFDDLAGIDSEVSANLERLRKKRRGPQIKLQAAQRALAAAKRTLDDLVQEVAGIDNQIAEVVNRQLTQRQKLHFRILDVTPIAQEFLQRCRDEAFELEQTPYDTRRVPTGRRNALGEPEVLEANNSQSIATRRMALINAAREAEKLAVTTPSESTLRQQLGELYAALPAIESPTLKLKDEA